MESLDGIDMDRKKVFFVYLHNDLNRVEGQIITVDDKWGGLRLEVPITIQVW